MNNTDLFYLGAAGILAGIAGVIWWIKNKKLIQEGKKDETK